MKFTWDRESGRWVEYVVRGNVPRGATPGAIVKNYEHIARCLPLRAKFDKQGRMISGIPGAKRYDPLGRAVCLSRNEKDDLAAANGRTWDTE